MRIKVRFSSFACTALLLVLAGQAFGDEIAGTVIGIADGDTFTLLLPDRQQAKIRLAEIDAPEAGQPFGNRSRRALSALIFGKEVTIAVQTTDRYGRIVGRPYVRGVDVCEEMVRSGAAWAFREYLRDKRLLELEADARDAKRGLWGLSEARRQAPWEWRRYGDASPSTPASDSDCRIKGNINSRGVRIYHVPGSSSYGATRIDRSKGERWFCTEAEAERAGWRVPRN